MLTKYVHGLQDKALYHPNWMHFEGIMASQNFNYQNLGISRVSFLGIKRKSHWDVTYMMRYKIHYIRKIPLRNLGCDEFYEYM